MFKIQSSVMLLAIVAVLTMCSSAAHAQTKQDTLKELPGYASGHVERIPNVDSLITDSATGADAVKFINVVFSKPEQGNIGIWIVAVLMAFIALYKHFKVVEHKKALAVAKEIAPPLFVANPYAGNEHQDKTWTKEDAKQWNAGRADMKVKEPDVTSSATYQAKKRLAGNPAQYREGGKFAKKVNIPKNDDGTVNTDMM